MVSSYFQPANDLLRGAGAIAAYLLDDCSKRRAVYHLIEAQDMPVFRVGRRIYARKSTLSAWIKKLEAEQTEIARFSVGLRS